METLRTNMGWRSREVVERYVKAFDTSRHRAVEAVARPPNGPLTSLNLTVLIPILV